MEHVSLLCVRITVSLPILIAPVCNDKCYENVMTFLRNLMYVKTKMENKKKSKDAVFFHTLNPTPKWPICSASLSLGLL